MTRKDKKLQKAIHTIFKYGKRFPAAIGKCIVIKLDNGNGFIVQFYKVPKEILNNEEE